MSDNPEQVEVIEPTSTPEPEPEYTSHTWHYRPNRTSESEAHEFPLAVNQTTAQNLIASRLGLRALPEDGTVGRNPLKPLDSKPKKSA